MIRLIIAFAAIALTIAASPAAHAVAEGTSAFDCAGFKSDPPEPIERDPVVTTKIAIEGSDQPHESPLDFVVVHETLNGNAYSRSQQYRDIRLWRDRNGDHWSGTSIKNPRKTMIGSLVYSESHGIRAPRYVEKIFNGKRLERTVISTCAPATGGIARTDEVMTCAGLLSSERQMGIWYVRVGDCVLPGDALDRDRRAILNGCNPKRKFFAACEVRARVNDDGEITHVYWVKRIKPAELEKWLEERALEDKARATDQ